jgi:hypothetical protein
MIESKSRALYIGASDTSQVVGSWKTETFKKWWQQKLGIDYTPSLGNKYTMAGTYYEHAILDALGIENKDAQILLPELRLRVNYDGITFGDGIEIHEVKTHKADKEFKVSKQYWRQAQVEMYAILASYRIPARLYINAYPMTEEHYRDYFIPIDKSLIKSIRVDYDPDFISEYLGKLSYLKECIDKGAFPTEEGYEKHIAGKQTVLPDGGDKRAAQTSHI